MISPCVNKHTVLPNVCCLPCGVNAGFITVVDRGRWWSGSLSPPESVYGRKSVVVEVVVVQGGWQRKVASFLDN